MLAGHAHIELVDEVGERHSSFFRCHRCSQSHRSSNLSRVTTHRPSSRRTPPCPRPWSSLRCQRRAPPGDRQRGICSLSAGADDSRETAPRSPVLRKPGCLSASLSHEPSTSPCRTHVDHSDGDTPLLQVIAQQMADHVCSSLASVMPEHASAFALRPEPDGPALGREENDLCIRRERRRHHTGELVRVRVSPGGLLTASR